MKYLRTMALAFALMIATPVSALDVGLAADSRTNINANGVLETSADVSVSGGVRSEAATGPAGGETDTVVVTRASVDSQTDVRSDVSSPSSVATSADLSAYASAILEKDDNVSAASLSREAVTLGYKERARLFGILPVLIDVKATVHSDGQVSLDYPWYAFLTIVDDTSIHSNVQAAVSSTLDASSTTASFSAHY